MSMPSLVSCFHISESSLCILQKIAQNILVGYGKCACDLRSELLILRGSAALYRCFVCDFGNRVLCWGTGML